MSFQNVTTVTQIDKLIKELAKETGAQVVNNARDTTSLIANNGNRYDPNAQN